MPGHTLYGASEILVAAAVAASLLVAGETGFQLGRRRRRRLALAAGAGSSGAAGALEAAAEKAQLDLMQAALLGLVALLMGFTFSMTISRFDTRKERVVEEANAIGTTALRVSLIPAGYRTEASALLVEYVELRLQSAHPLVTPEDHGAEAHRAQEVQLRLWTLAARAAAEDPRSTETALFVEALNRMIDDQALRAAALADHVPVMVLWLLWLASIAAAWLTGFGAGAGGRRGAVGLLMFALVTALVFVMILDLDRPWRGLVRVSMQSMRDARELVLRLDAARR